MIYTQDVTAWADVGGANFRLTHLEVERTTGRTIGTAKVKGIVEDTENLTLGADVKVYAGATSSDTPWNDDLNTYSQIFGGEAHSAKQNEEGVVTIEAFDSRDELQSKTVKLEVESPTYSYTVLKDLLEEEYFGGVTNNLDNADMFTPYLAPRSEFVGDYRRPWRFGNANRGLPLVDALEDLINSLGGNLWVNREGIVMITPYPDHVEWVTPFITKINAGEETRNAERVIFEGSGTASELGAGASYIHTQTSHTSAAGIEGGENEPEAPEKTLTDDNISSQEEADQQAFQESVSQDQNRDMGSITIIGNADMELYDHVIVPDLTYDYANIETPLPNDVQSGQYKVDGLTHKLNSSDGFLTTIQLSPPIEETYGRCTVASGAGFQQQYLSQYDNSVEEQRVSGQDDNSGFLSGLFG